jgi:uncharacterized protein YijF (DUF1287 family)
MKKYIIRIKNKRFIIEPRRVLAWLSALVVLIVVVANVTSSVSDPSTSSASGSSSGGSSGSAETQNYPVYKSKVDKDGDGIDDQTDILKGARAYVATNPQYMSKYYESGYPDDNHGVCTDVTAFALKGAGYDLRTLINDDVTANPQNYPDITTPEINIDFRRVENQNAYFKHHAKSLTTDLSKKSQWQGGDIVVFTHHIGIVSSKRNEDGIPYLIHLSKPGQKVYEQRYGLVKREKLIIAHYRIS